jgi:DNA-binding transcriptional LysR family regulator
MLDGLTLDQLRTFIAAADEGSFSAAGRKLHRAQSAISQTILTLESQLGLNLFDRSSRLPVLTPQGQAMLAEARAVTTKMDRLRAHAKSLAGGLEAELSVVVDVMFPIGVLTEAISAFQSQFPTTPLRLYVEALGAVLQPVLTGRCAFGIMGTLPIAPAHLITERLLGVRMALVAAPTHPLVARPGPIAMTTLAKHIQLVLTDRSDLSAGREFGVISPRTWRIADLGAKHAFLLAGLGWGSMPQNVVETDIATGKLVPLIPDAAPPQGFIMTMSAFYPAAAPPGPAGSWLISRLRQDGQEW